MYRKFRNVPIFEDFSPICPYFLGFRVGKYVLIMSSLSDPQGLGHMPSWQKGNNLILCIAFVCLTAYKGLYPPPPPPPRQVCVSSRLARKRGPFSTKNAASGGIQACNYNIFGCFKIPVARPFDSANSADSWEKGSSVTNNPVGPFNIQSGPIVVSYNLRSTFFLRCTCILSMNSTLAKYCTTLPQSEMPLFRKFPEIRKFQIERKNFRKNETVSLDNIIDQKGGKRFWKKGNVSKFTY